MNEQKRIRKWVYRDHYYPNMTRHDYLEHEKHAGKHEPQSYCHSVQSYSHSTQSTA